MAEMKTFSADYLRVDGRNIMKYGSSTHSKLSNRKRADQNMQILFDWLDLLFDEPIPIVVLPNWKKLRKKNSWVKSGWINFIEDRRNGYDDYWIIQSALQSNSFVLTNDRYGDWKKWKESMEHRLIRYEIISNQLILDLGMLDTTSQDLLLDIMVNQQKIGENPQLTTTNKSKGGEVKYD